MASKAIKIPGPDHPITITPAAGRVIVTANGKVVADSPAALILQEGSYPPVHYIPRADADMAAFEPTDTQSWCPYKGDASYLSIAGSGIGRDAIWSYETPHDAVAPIAGHLAFYPSRVDSIEILPAD